MSDSLVTYRALNRGTQPLDGTPCREFCLNGNRCVLDGKVKHEWHMCGSPTCACKQPRTTKWRAIYEHERGCDEHPGQAHKSAVPHREPAAPATPADSPAGSTSEASQGGTR